jgi:lipopolysaccharide biosynthesis protein
VGERDTQIASLHQAVGERDTQIEVLANAVAALKASASWRVTGPLRFIGRPLISVARLYRIAIKALQLGGGVSGTVALTFKILRNEGISGIAWRWGNARALLASDASSQGGPGVHPSSATFALDPEEDIFATEARDYVPIATSSLSTKSTVRLICFYLPQFHSIPENDAWWGKGFTEWSNVKPAKPQFVGHYQPHVPAELGYYDLLDPTLQRRQIELAKLYGIEGFCFYFYWFGGKRLLEAPVENYLDDGSLDLPFCLCWANENWSRRWDGLDSEILIAQQHSAEDDLAFIAHVSKYMRDPRYIRISDKPLLLVYRPSLLPSAKSTAKRWRDWCRNNGLGEIYLAYTQSFEAQDPEDYGFDAAIEFPPNNSAPPNITQSVTKCNDEFEGTVYDWDVFVDRSRDYKTPKYRLFRGVCPSWDNTARRKNKGTIFLNSTPSGYQEWLLNAIRETCRSFENPEERLIFVNAWNEWAEGAHLEPDKRYGYAYLEATRLAIVKSSLALRTPTLADTQVVAIVIHAFYEDVFVEILDYLKNITALPIKLYVTTTPENEDSVRQLLLSQPREYFLRIVENRGRDILPFLKIMPEVISAGHEFFVKVHTKKSLHRTDGDKWREDLYNKLVDDTVITDAVRSLRENPHIGILGPDNHLVEMSYFWGSNAERVIHLASRMGVEHHTLVDLSFVAGSMFIARVDAMLPLLSLAMDDSHFECELGQVDGTLAHAIERLFAVSAHSITLHTTCPSNVVLSKYEFV